MAYDETLAARIREMLASETDVTEMRMFGGLAFLVRGNMAIAAGSQGGAMVRVNPAESDQLVESTSAEVVIMRGRAMPGWLPVAGDHLTERDELRRWVDRGREFARSLPPK